MAEKAAVPWDDPADEVITARVPAKEKGVHPVSIYRAVKEGRLKGSRSGNTILIRRRDLAAWTPVGHRPASRTKGKEPAAPPLDEAEARRIQREKNEPLIQLLRKWRTEGDEEEQRRAFENLKKTLDEDRIGYRKIYPEEQTRGTLMQTGLSQIILGGQSLIADGVKLCREIGYDGLEIMMTESGELTPEAGEAEYREVRRIGEAAGIRFPSLCGGGRRGRSLTGDDPEERQQAIEIHTKLLEAAAALGIDTVLTTGGSVSPTVPYDVAFQRLEDGLKRLAPVAERTRVNLALENVWNKLLLSPLEARDLLDRIGSAYVGWYFDTGNVVLFGFPEQWIRILGKRIKKVHFKDFKRQGYQWTQLMDGDVDWPAVMRELRAIGYDDTVISEVGGDRETYAETRRRMEKILAL